MNWLIGGERSGLCDFNSMSTIDGFVLFMYLEDPMYFICGIVFFFVCFVFNAAFPLRCEWPSSSLLSPSLCSSVCHMTHSVDESDNLDFPFPDSFQFRFPSICPSLYWILFSYPELSFIFNWVFCGCFEFLSVYSCLLSVHSNDAYSYPL